MFGWLRKIFIGLFVFILLFLFIFMNFLLVLTLSLSYNNVLQIATPYIEEQIKNAPIFGISENTNITEEISSFYYRQYECSFATCFQKLENTTFYLSQQFRSSIIRILLFIFFGITISVFFIFLLVEKKRSAFFSVGSVLSASSFPLLKPALFSIVIPGKGSDMFFSLLFTLIMNESRTIFLGSFLTGLGCIFIGLLFFIYSKMKPREEAIEGV